MLVWFVDGITANENADGGEHGRSEETGNSENTTRKVPSPGAPRNARVESGQEAGRRESSNARRPLVRGICVVPARCTRVSGGEEGRGEAAGGQCLMLLATKLDAFPAFLSAGGNTYTNGHIRSDKDDTNTKSGIS